MFPAPGRGGEQRDFHRLWRRPGNIAPTWRLLMEWLETSPYRLGKHQWLEQHLGGADTALDELELDLFMPIGG